MAETLSLFVPVCRSSPVMKALYDLANSIENAAASTAAAAAALAFRGLLGTALQSCGHCIPSPGKRKGKVGKCVRPIGNCMTGKPPLLG
jgi:hypothetical protein